MKLVMLSNSRRSSAGSSSSATGPSSSPFMAFNSFDFNWLNFETSRGTLLTHPLLLSTRQRRRELSQIQLVQVVYPLQLLKTETPPVLMALHPLLHSLHFLPEVVHQIAQLNHWPFVSTQILLVAELKLPTSSGTSTPRWTTRPTTSASQTTFITHLYLWNVLLVLLC